MGQISIQLPEGQKYGPPCGVTGVGDYDIETGTENLAVGSQTIQAQRSSLYERSSEGQDKRMLSEFYMMELPDGIRIHFGGNWTDPQGSTYHDYLISRELLVKILATFKVNR